MTGILAGLRIVEGSAFIAAPMAGMTLAQLGADVIRFDDLKGGLDSDRWPVTKDGQSIYWAGLNKGKRSIAVDLRSTKGRELLTALITVPGEGGGIFSTNMPARGWLSYEELVKKRADLIAIGRQALYNPFWPVHAAQELGCDANFEMWNREYGWWLDKRKNNLPADRAATGQPR